MTDIPQSPQAWGKRSVILHTLLALVVLLALVTACGGGGTESGPVNITYTYPNFAGNVNLKDLPAVQSAMNAILKKTINVTVTLKPIDGAAYDQKMKLAFTSGQNCDVTFTAPWINNFYQNVSNGNLLPLDDLLQKDAPKLYASLTSKTWEAAKVNGKIYGAINQQPFTRRFGPSIRADIATKYHLDLNAITKFEDLEPFLAAVKKGEPGMYPLTLSPLYSPAYLGLDVVDGSSVDTGIIVIRADDQNRKVINAATLPEFKHMVELSHKWYTAGYMPQNSPADLNTDFRAGKYAGQIFVVNPDSVAALKQSMGFDFVTKALGTPLLTTGGVNATMNGICRSSAHPDAAMKFIEQLNTNLDVYRLLCHGVENKDYVFVDKEKGVIGFPKGITSSNAPYNPNTPWMFGNLFNSYYTDSSIVGAYDQMRTINASATPSVALGFSFNPDKVKSQVAVLATVEKQYGEPLLSGQVDPAKKLPEYLQKLQEAGIDDVIAEIQSQLDAWSKSS